MLEGTATFALSQHVLYFCNKVRAGVVLLNIVVKRCTSSDVESKSLFKAGANAHARARKKSQGVAMTSASGRGGSDFGGEIETLCAQLYSHFFPEATSSPAVKEWQQIADRDRRCSNALRVPPPAGRVLAATQGRREHWSALGLHRLVSQRGHGL